jgi:hypothetical protein
MDYIKFHWSVICRLTLAFLLVFSMHTLYAAIQPEPCVLMGPGVARCTSLCGVPWGTTQILYTDTFIQWSCLPGSVRVRDYFLYSPEIPILYRRY